MRHPFGTALAALCGANLAFPEEGVFEASDAFLWNRGISAEEWIQVYARLD
ncbi:MAG: hypothetical protein ACLQVN_03175 [Bryobacteraceae bacterium]